MSAWPLALFPLLVALVGTAIDVGLKWLTWRSGTVAHLSPDFPWMTPLPVLVPVCVVSALLLAGPVRRSSWAVGALTFLGTALVGFNLALLIPGMAHYAAALLAAGAGVQFARLASGSPATASRIVKRAFFPLAVGVCLAIGAATAATRFNGAAPAQNAAADSPNVIIITLDTVRASNLSLYGYQRATTPKLSAFARQGAAFESAWSVAPWTLPSHASMFTGRWPHEMSANYDVPLDGAFQTLAEFFGARGYATGGFVSNLQYGGRGSGLARGFQQYEDYPRTPGAIVASSTAGRTLADNFRLRRLLENDEHLDRVDATVVNARASDWLAGVGNRPFLLFLNYFDAHEPYLPPAPFDRAFGQGRSQGRFSPLHHWLWDPSFGHRPLAEAEVREEVDSYDGAIAELDQRVSELLDSLASSGRLANTIVVLTADHGEEFGEHGVYDHGYSLYQSGLHVPLVIVAPGRVPAETRVQVPVSLRDLASTVVTLATGTAGSFPGVPLQWAWTAGSQVTHGSPVLSEVRRPPGQPEWFPVSKGDMRSLNMNGVRYIRNGDGREELYRLSTDRLEREDLSARPESREALESARAAIAQVLATGKP